MENLDLFYCTLTALRRKSLIINGAGEGNRTLVSGLGSPHSTIEPHPRARNGFSKCSGEVQGIQCRMSVTNATSCRELWRPSRPAPGMDRAAGSFCRAD